MIYTNWETDYQRRMALARRVDADYRYYRGLNAILKAMFARRPKDSVLFHIRGTCKDDCSWCPIEKGSDLRFKGFKTDEEALGNSYRSNNRNYDGIDISISD